MRRVHGLFQKKETDETWQLFNAALNNIKSWVEQSNAHEYEGFGKHLRSLRDGINHAVNLLPPYTTRSRLLVLISFFVDSSC